MLEREGCSADELRAVGYGSFPEPVSTARWEFIWTKWWVFRYLVNQQVDVLFCPDDTCTIVCVATCV